MAMPTDLVLIRHGESEINAARVEANRKYLKRLRERPDALYRVTDAGILQIQIASDWIRQTFFKEGLFDVYIASGFNRSAESAGRMFPEANWEISRYTHERDWGDLVGIPQAERLQQFADVFALREQDALYPKIPNGESIASECNRIERVLDYLAREHHGKRVLIVTHGEIMWCFRIVLENIAPWQFRDMYNDSANWIPNCGILHYSRRDPMTGIEGEHLAWMHAVNPLISQGAKPWARIEKRLWQGKELIEIVEKIPRLRKD